MTFWADARPVARKTHLCDDCGRMILPGETYRRGSGLDRSYAWTWKECAHCLTFMRLVISAWGLEEYSGDDLHEYEPENVAEMRVKVQWRRKWTNSQGDLYPVPELLTEQVTNAQGFTSTRILGIRPGGAS